ncbi:MAG: peptidylprolyl isomerase [Nanoarchaeota archaeon]|nr:peptidylprolyl isomerase [Nanoarchaeota archaeon]MBU4086530.1 peptidylprolyl isomerase [Nanoarchaeota archaeon]
MADKINKNDFIELDFTGRVKNGEIFDTNIPEEAKKIGLEIESRPLIICIGQNMILPSIDEFLEGKEIGKYTLELAPEKAFGSRSREYIQTMPTKIFHEKQIVPQSGMVFQFDNLMGRISAVSGGRVIVDFNNPLAGKEVVYEINAKRIVSDIKEKAETLINLYFRQKLEFEIQEKTITIRAPKQFSQLIDFFKPKFKETLNLELEFKEQAEEKQSEAVAEPEKELAKEETQNQQTI